MTLEAILGMAHNHQKPDPGPEVGEAGTGTVQPGNPPWFTNNTQRDRKCYSFGLGEMTRGGPAAREGTKSEDLRDFGSR